MAEESKEVDPVKSKSLSRYLKFVPLVALFAFGVVLISLPRGSEATPVGAPTLTLTNIAVQGTTVVQAIYTDDTPAGSGSAVLSVSPVIGTFVAGATVTPPAGDGVETVVVAPSTVTVSEDADTLATVKTIAATFQCTTGGVATFTIAHGGTTSPQSVTLLCGNYGGQFPGYPTYPPYGGFPGGYPQYPNGTIPGYSTTTAVTVSASPASTTCTSPSSISITLKDANGNIAPDGTSVTVSASTGTISPNVVSTSGGYATTTFTAPNSANGTATVTATSGQGTGFATVSFTCTGGSTSPASPVYPGDTSYPTYPTVITPPNTGDAGLAANATNSTYAGLALVTLSVIGLGAGTYSLSLQRNER
jgi:adhesin/invasin